MKISALLLAALELYRAALPGYRYEFPRDHFNHPEFQTEWWYYTGNLRDAQGRRFGFELTFFRQGVDRSAEPAAVWDVRDAWLAHLALSDIDGGRFLHAERLNRSGAGLAGASLDQARVWNGNWHVQWDLRAGTQRMQAIDPRFSFQSRFAAVEAARDSWCQRRQPEGGRERDALRTISPSRGWKRAAGSCWMDGRSRWKASPGWTTSSSPTS